MKSKTIIQTINTTPYITVSELEFLWTPAKSGDIFLDDKKVVVQEIRDKIDTTSGLLIRYIRVHVLH